MSGMRRVIEKFIYGKLSEIVGDVELYLEGDWSLNWIKMKTLELAKDYIC